MGKLSNSDFLAIKDSIDNGKEVRFHIIHSRSGLTTKCRLWHTDGRVLGSASGGGYDKAGAALGQAIEALFGEELRALPLPTSNKNGSHDGLYGLGEHNGKRYLDGACGLECMLAVLRALGFTDTQKFDTGKLSDMILARRPNS